MNRSTPPTGSSTGNPTSAPAPSAPPASSTRSTAAQAPQQLEIFPVEIMKTWPSAGGADSAFVGEGRDRMKYNIKTVTKTPNVPAAEWFCHHLAEAVEIAAVTPRVVRIQGELAYGSRWERGMLEQGRNNEVLTGQLAGCELGARFSALYAFDLFVHNNDRHAGNFVFIEVDKLYRLMAVDFSRAWTNHPWPLPAPASLLGSSTVGCGKLVRQHFGFDLAEADGVLGKIENVNSGFVEQLLRRMPAPWLGDAAKAAMVQWWRDGSMNTRVADVRKGLSNGTYL
jgi:hypothetical protein